MNRNLLIFNKLVVIFLLVLFSFKIKAQSSGIVLQKEALLSELKVIHRLNEDKIAKLKAIIMGSSSMGQGEPNATFHPVTSQRCLIERGGLSSFANSNYEKICGAKFMAPVYDVKNQKPQDANFCIDQFEFPNIPCSYPLTWVKASEAFRICETMGKRLCDASEWEGACSGDYQFKHLEHQPPNVSNWNSIHQLKRIEHNKNRKIIWAYGSIKNHKKCATGSKKSLKCDEALRKGKGVFASCGSNTFPSGYFKECRSPLDVYDQHGNAAEHMNLALFAEQSTRSGGFGLTEMKGSWFIFSSVEAHLDDCHWRAPFWHGSFVNDEKSHANYHLGFRCCKTVENNKIEK